MPRPRFVILGIASTAAASLLLAGCTLLNDGGGSGGKLTYEDSPLLPYTTALYGGDKDNDEYIADANAIEELIATCMSKEGFEYVPVDQSQYYTFEDEEDVDRRTEEWVASNGYGYNLTDEQQAEQNEKSETIVDPNQEYAMSLTESEQNAYYEVLHGPQPTEEEMADPDFVYEQLGCYGEANAEVRAGHVSENPEFKSLIASINEMWEKQLELPEIKKLDTEWSSCMADAGYSDLNSKNDVFDLMNLQSEEAWGDGGVEPSKEKRAELRDYEIDLALADFHCAEDIDYEQKVLAAQFTNEEQFIADNKAELDAMLAAASTTD